MDSGIEFPGQATAQAAPAHGPVYRLRSVCGVKLPEAAVRPRDQYLSYEDAHREWDALVEQNARGG